MSKKKLKEEVNLFDPKDPGYTAPEVRPLDMGAPELGAEEFRAAMEEEGFPPEEIAKVFGILSSAPGGIDIASLNGRRCWKGPGRRGRGENAFTGRSG